MDPQSEKTKIVAKLKPKEIEKELFTLSDLTLGTLVCRPSKHNRSPFVGDALVNGEEKIVHIPSMDMGGKCVQGKQIYMKVAKNSGKKGKYGTPCCDYISQAIIVDEIENPSPIICGAHPSLGETVAESLLSIGSVFEPISSSKIITKKGQVCNIAGCDMRSDFLVQTDSGENILVEVKTVVDTDYDYKNKLQYSNFKMTQYYNKTDLPYKRTGLFPWGRGNQKGPEGEKVVSSRAIKHVREMNEIAKGDKTDPKYPNLIPYVLFVVVRNDAVKFTPNKEACPSFHKYLLEAYTNGVKMSAVSISFIESDGDIKVNFVKTIPIVF